MAASASAAAVDSVAPPDIARSLEARRANATGAAITKTKKKKKAKKRRRRPSGGASAAPLSSTSPSPGDASTPQPAQRVPGRDGDSGGAAGKRTHTAVGGGAKAAHGGVDEFAARLAARAAQARQAAAAASSTTKAHSGKGGGAAAAAADGSRKQRRAAAKAEARGSKGRASGGAGGRRRAPPLRHPFEVDYCDHFETPAVAYTDVDAVLRAIAAAAGVSAPSLKLYDPFYCAGRAKKLLNAAGYPNVYHKNEDFYAKDPLPEHDVLITNPPYSGDHKERALAHCLRSGKPWLLLLPSYVATRQWFTAAVAAACAAPERALLYIVPAASYDYDHPEGTGKDAPPFFSIWFVGGLADAARQRVLRGALRGAAAVYGTREELQHALLRRGVARAGKRGNPRQRKKRRLAAAKGLAS